MSCGNCSCDTCVKERVRAKAFGEMFPCEYCGEPGMSTVTSYGSLMHNCFEKAAVLAAARVDCE